MENEIVEWNPQKKLRKREKEIDVMNEQTGGAFKDLEKENDAMEKELEKVIKKLEGGDMTDITRDNGNELKNYLF